tara:strand:- start:368 stop:649 length:282 start_codon:yes stop_codon:yes gene_type:complete
MDVKRFVKPEESNERKIFKAMDHKAVWIFFSLGVKVLEMMFRFFLFSSSLLSFCLKRAGLVIKALSQKACLNKLSQNLYSMKNLNYVLEGLFL